MVVSSQFKIVGWRLGENTPWLGVPQGFRFRRDHWIPGRMEVEWLRSSMDDSIPGSSIVLDGRIVLFHRIPSPGESYSVEVYSHASRIGVLEYDGSGWSFKPSGALASILEGIGFNIIRIDFRGRLKGKKVRVPPGDCRSGSYILVSSGGFVGPARIIDRRECIVRVRDMAPRGFSLLQQSTISDAVMVNRAYIERLGFEAVEFIRREAGGGKVVVAVSGGIDSSVTLALTVRALGPGRVTAVYADTGMEFKESLETVEKLASMMGVDLVIVSARLDPLEEIARRGLMTRSNRWCTRILKLSPLARYYRRVNARIVVDGARALESEARSITPRSGVNPLIPFVKRILPIHSWSRLEVQLYAHLEGLPVNPLYDRGLQRIGCILCPAMHLYEIRVAEEIMPGFYNRLYKYLVENGVRDPRSYIHNGSWRRRSG